MDKASAMLVNNAHQCRLFKEMNIVQIKLNLTNLIQSRFPDGSNNLKEAEKIIKESGAFEKTFNLAKSYIQQANNNLKALPDNEYKKDLFLLGDFILARLI